MPNADMPISVRMGLGNLPSLREELPVIVIPGHDDDFEWPLDALEEDVLVELEPPYQENMDVHYDSDDSVSSMALQAELLAAAEHLRLMVSGPIEWVDSEYDYDDDAVD